MKLRSLLILCLMGFGSFAMAESHICTAKSNGHSFETKGMKSYKLAYQDAVARCNSSTKTSNDVCARNVECRIDGVSNKLAGIQHVCKTYSRGVTYEIAHSNYDEAVLVLNQCLDQRNSIDDECRQRFQCKEIKREVPFVCYIDNQMEKAENGATLKEAIAETLRANSIDEERAFGRLYCSEKGGAPFKIKAPYKCWSLAAATATPAAEGSDLDRMSDKALKQCYAQAPANQAECRKNLTCEGEGLSRRLMIKTQTCSTKSAGLSLNSSDTDNVQAQILNLCRKDSSMDLGECKANLTCDGDRVSRVVHRCTTNNDAVQISAIDIDKDAAERSARDLCEAHAGSADPACAKNVRCDNTVNNVRMDFKNTIQTKSGGSTAAVVPAQTNSQVVRPLAPPAPPMQSSGGVIQGQGKAADVGSKAGSGTIAPAKAFSADGDGALLDLPNPAQ